MIQGDVCWCTFKEPDKRRPVLILTRNAAIRDLTSVTVAQITTTTRELESVVWLNGDDGMPEVCAVNLDNIRTVEKRKIGSKITQLGSEKMNEVFASVAFAFGFENLLHKTKRPDRGSI